MIRALSAFVRRHRKDELFALALSFVTAGAALYDFERWRLWGFVALLAVFALAGRAIRKMQD